MAFNHNCVRLLQDSMVIYRFAIWLPTFVGACLALIQMQEVSDLAKSAPQQGAGASMAVAYVVIPYCMSRALSEVGAATALERFVKTIRLWVNYGRLPLERTSTLGGIEEHGSGH